MTTGVEHNQELRENISMGAQTHYVLGSSLPEAKSSDSWDFVTTLAVIFSRTLIEKRQAAVSGLLQILTHTVLPDTIASYLPFVSLCSMHFKNLSITRNFCSIFPTFSTFSCKYIL